MKPTVARTFLRQKPLFSDIKHEAEPYYYEPDFRQQLKGRLLWDGILTQIIRESTIAPFDFLNPLGYPIRGLGKRTAEVAWNLASAAYYKAGARPWKLSGVVQAFVTLDSFIRMTRKAPMLQRHLRCTNVPRFGRRRCL